MDPVADGRRDAIDVARVGALLVVVLGHLTLAVIDRTDEGVRGANLLSLHPGWAWVAAAAPMPVFFVAAGWANARASPTSVVPRIRTLVGTAAAVVVAWSAAVIAARLATGDPGVVADGARIATQPVWFLAAYVPFAAFGGPLARGAARAPLRLVGGCLIALAVLDLARFVGGSADWIGWVGFPLAWVVPWLVGGWWRDRRSRGELRERRTGVLLVVAGLGVALLLVHGAGYSPALIDAVDGARSNTTPPTLYTAVVGLAQAGGLMAIAERLDAVGRRRRRRLDRAGAASVGVYLWHLTALAICAGVVATGLAVPRRLTAAWWLTRPLWWAAVIAVTLALVGLTAVISRRGPVRQLVRPGRPRAMAGVVLSTGAAAVVGRYGPRSVPLAFACSALFVIAWWLLRGRREPVEEATDSAGTGRQPLPRSGPAREAPIDG